MKGNWTRIGNPAEWETYICSECSKRVEYPTRFCPNCGAEMDESINDKTYAIGTKGTEYELKAIVTEWMNQYLDEKHTMDEKLMMVTFYAQNFGGVPEEMLTKIRKALEKAEK